MNTDKKVYQQRVFDCTRLPSEENWKTALWPIALLAAIYVVTAMSSARADMVFDFQMKLARKGNAEAQFKVGEMYEAGRGVEKNMEEAMKWINKAAAQGNKAAGYKLLYRDLEKNGINKENRTKLIELKNTAQNGNGYAQYYVGLMLSRGVGFKQNSEQALVWLGKASLAGVISAETEIMHVNQSRALQQASRDAQRKAQQQEQDRLEKEQRIKKKAQRKKEQQKRKEAARKKKAEQEKTIDQRREARRIAAEKEAEKQRLAAQKQAQAEKKRQLVMQQRRSEDQQKKIEFESDPCVGRSARFLSTCR